MWRAGLCTIAVAIVATACGSSEKTLAHPALALKDAQAVDRLARAYLQTYTEVGMRVEDRLSHEYDLCPLTRSNPNGTPGRPGEQQFDVLDQAAILQATLPRYRALARAIARVNPRSAQLRAASKAMLTVATAYRALRHADTHYCSILRKWEAQQWKPQFDVANAVDASILTMPPTQRVDAAYATLKRTALALRGAGGTARDINLLLRFTRLFWSRDA